MFSLRKDKQMCKSMMYVIKSYSKAHFFSLTKCYTCCFFFFCLNLCWCKFAGFLQNSSLLMNFYKNALKMFKKRSPILSKQSVTVSSYHSSMAEHSLNYEVLTTTCLRMYK